jgi:hypothetical protein
MSNNQRRGSDKVNEYLYDFGRNWSFYLWYYFIFLPRGLLVLVLLVNDGAVAVAWTNVRQVQRRRRVALERQQKGHGSAVSVKRYVGSTADDGDSLESRQGDRQGEANVGSDPKESPASHERRHVHRLQFRKIYFWTSHSKQFFSFKRNKNEVLKYSTKRKKPHIHNSSSLSKETKIKFWNKVRSV